MKTASYTALPYPQTPETAAAWFREYGVCKTRWARHFGLDRFAIIDLLRGQLKGNWGAAHRAAVLLGLKPDPQTLNAPRAKTRRAKSTEGERHATA